MRKENPIKTSVKSGNFRPTKSGAGMTRKGVMAYRRANPGSKLSTAVTGKVKPGSKSASRRNLIVQDQRVKWKCFLKLQKILIQD